MFKNNRKIEEMFINEHKIEKGSKIITKQKNVQKQSQDSKMFENDHKIEKCL